MSASAREPDNLTLDDLGGWPTLITRLLGHHHLTATEAGVAMSTILSGDATAAQLIGFVVALRAKGESSEELSGLLDAVLAAAEIVPLSDAQRSAAVDIVGTGGDRSHSINVSTISALVVAGAGVPVCKHGARASSSKCGAADVLEALGVTLDLSPAGVVHCIETVGIGFCLAPRFHPAFRFAAPARREIGIPTVFNLLGPMANPGRVRRQVIGVADSAFAERMLQSLRDHGSTDAWVVHGNGLDELGTDAPSQVLALHDGVTSRFEVDPAELGLVPARVADLAGGAPADNAAAARRILAGEGGPHRDIVLLNSAAALVVAGRVAGLADGIELAARSIDSGAAADTLEAFVQESRAAEALG